MTSSNGDTHCTAIGLHFWQRFCYLAVLVSFLSIFFTQHAAGGGVAEPPAPIKIGAIFSESGIAAPHNQPLIEMTRLAVKHVNDTGGVLGRPLELILIDNNSTPIGSALAAHQLVKQDVTAVIGAHWSSHSLAIAPILQEAAIPMISPGSTNPQVTKDKDYVFRACFVDSFQGVAMAKFAREELGAQNGVVVTNIDEDYSIMLGQFFSDAFQAAGGKILSEIIYRGNSTDFSENIKELLRLQPDVVYLPGYSRDSGLFIKQAEKMGFASIFLGGDAWDEIEKYSGPAVNGSYQSAPWHPEVPFQASGKMKELFYSVHGREIENSSSPLAYDAVMILVEAIKRAGTTDRRAVRDALAETTDFPGTTGHITFDENGDPLSKGIIIISFQHQKHIYQKTITP